MKLWRYGQALEYLGRRYRLDGMLGSGGMADVCLAWDEREQREVALKLLKSDDLDQETLNRFMKEAAQIAHWQHPHILRVYESLQVELVDAANGSVLFYMVSEYARGGDLQKRLTPGRPFPLSATFALFRQLCDAVQYAHERGVIHRDLKPLNMLFRRPESGPEEVVLSDFGLAVQVDASHHTFAHGGTLAYMAPEQFQGHASPASDIFALGVILYQLCTGGFPFRRTLRDLPRIVQGQTPEPTRPSLINPELPPLLDEVMLRALRELPAERYRQPSEFWEAIELALTMSARTFPFIDELWQNAGQTWPYDSSARTQEPARADQEKGPHNASDSSPDEEQPEVEEGLVSALWIAREKQKASPARLPLPTNSIQISPNPAEDDVLPQIPPERAASATWQAVENQAPAAQNRAARQPQDAGSVWGADPLARGARGPGDTLGIAAPGEQKPRSRSGSRAGPAASRPASSLSGSTILPGPRSATRSEEQTSRRRQPFVFAENEEHQTSRRQPSSQLPLPGERQAQPVEPPGAFITDPAYQTNRHRASRFAADAATRGSEDGLRSQEQPRHISARASHNSASMASAYDVTVSNEVDPGSRTREVSASARRPPVVSARSNPRAPIQLARGLRGAQTSSSRSVPQGDSGQAYTHQRRRISPVALICGLFVLALPFAILGATTFQGNLLTFFGAPVVKITLQPRAQLVQENAALNLRTDGGQLAPGDIPGRLLSTTSSMQSATASATGSVPGKRATGELTFLNETSVGLTIQSTVITDKNGVKITFNGPVFIPANPPSTIIPGFAIDPGAAGNIPTLDLDQACCAPNDEIFVKNTAFTGGQDAVQNGVVQQKDIDGAAKPLIASGQTQARALLQKQMQANERAVGDPRCQTQLNADQKAGTLAKQVTVQVAVTCSESVYDAQAARQFFARDLQRQARANPALGANCTLVGQVALALQSVAPAPDGSVSGASLQFHAQGLWVYQFQSSTLHRLASLIAGKSQDASRVLLLQQAGVSGVQFSGSGSLPVNASEIQFNVQTPASTQG